MYLGDQEQQKRPDSLAPVAIEGPGIDEEAALMNRGKGKMVMVFAAALMLVGAASVWLMSGVDETRAYGEASAALTDIDKTGFDRFWGCVLEGVDLRNLESRADLAYQLKMRSAEGGIRYARKINRQCMEALDETQTRMDQLSVPEDLQAQTHAMEEALTDLRGAWSKYIAYMTGSDLKYDESEARPHLDHIADGWYRFKQGHARANKLVRERL